MRLAAAGMGVSAVAAGYIVNVDRATRQGQSLALVLANYFSMFTIVSTLLSAGALAAAATWTRMHPERTREPLGVALALAITTGPVLLLGVVYNVLLRGVPSEVAAADSAGIAMLDTYAVEVLHVIIPLYLLVDLLFARRRRGLPWWSLPVLTVYPLTWLLYTMVRGELVVDPSGAAAWWYPYPFLDPHGAGGWGSVLIYIGGIFAAFVAIGAGIIAIGRYRERRAMRHEVVVEAGVLHG
ncbi:Pr6Pr family membrane protein [Microbacterium sp. SSM24]|uniref:Pr6Pr family membrane protein n=1 Tax=Microbacterium sp. SSM24 TaxID=2991714 RepID=UPI0022272700|nr:Pr6Pr family membrane protein [Microbacterium sp. SSM24]MCW3492954.1 Pr6Pr family membrane protein [Microbacterium sp. SSM24]